MLKMYYKMDHAGIQHFSHAEIQYSYGYDVKCMFISQLCDILL